MSVVVRLDDPKYAGGPATVIAVDLSPEEYRRRFSDRDGCLPDDLRLWGGDGAVGDRVVLCEPSPEEIRRQWEEWRARGK